MKGQTANDKVGPNKDLELIGRSVEDLHVNI